MAGQRRNPGEGGLHDRSHRPRPWPFRPASVGWSVAVRGPACDGVSTARTPEPGVHGRIADGGAPNYASKHINAGQRHKPRTGG